jgi:hypothetical protein
MMSFYNYYCTTTLEYDTQTLKKKHFELLCIKITVGMQYLFSDFIPFTNVGMYIIYIMISDIN